MNICSLHLYTMKQKSSNANLQKALTFIMAVLVFGLAIFIPVSRNGNQGGVNHEHENIVSHTTFQGTPALPTSANPLLKLNPFLFDLPNLWLLLLLMTAPGIQRCQAFLSPIFVQKINFIFVSTQAP